MNLEDDSTPWLPTDIWHRLKRHCQEVRNPQEVFMEAAQQLREEGATPEAINKLRGAAAEGHKLA